MSADRWPGLSPAEVDVADLLARGATCAEIAARSGRSVKTVAAQRERVLRKLGLRSNVALARYAIRHGFVGVEATAYEANGGGA